MSFALRPDLPHRRTSGAAPIGTEPRQTFAHVYGLDEGALEYEVEGAPVAVSIAPDDLHKANGSGGDPYTMEFPNADTDRALVGERHRLLFVDDLRLGFACGGFSGYEGPDAPSALRALMSDLWNSDGPERPQPRTGV